MGDWQENSTEHTRLMADTLATEAHIGGGRGGRSTATLEAGRPSDYGSGGEEAEQTRSRMVSQFLFVF